MEEKTSRGLFKTAKVEVVDRKMKAFLILKNADPENSIPLSKEYIKDLLVSTGIKIGIKDEVINDILEGKINEDRVLVAEGDYPQPGNDSSIQFYISVEKSLKPQLQEDGHIDYKEVKIVESVAKDAPLAKKIIATVGSPGKDLFGNEIPGLYGKDVQFTAGQGTYRDPAENTLFRASIEGIIFYDAKSHTLEVQKLFVVPGSVDYSTGNLHVKSSVEIKQNIKAGFSVETPYNIDVKGGIEQAVVICGGSLNVKEGINGDGKNIITVGEDIHSGYISNQIIKCSGTVHVSFELRNSSIECDDEVIVVKNNGVIIGGKITATNKVTSPIIGNDYGVNTEIEVGVVLKHKEKYIRKQTEKNDIEKNVEELKKQISYIAQKPDNNARAMQLMNYKEVWGKYTALLIKIKNDLKEIETAYYAVENPSIFVINKVFPGTIIKIKDKLFEVKDMMTHVKFHLVNNEIAYTNFK